MGKKRITQLLDQLKENQQQELQNAAAIFTVAQVAVNQLQAQLPAEPEAIAALPASSQSNAETSIQPTLKPIDQAELKKRYGSHVACRRAAKQLGIKFSKTPSWQQLEAAFSYQAACQDVVHAYLQAYPTDQLHGVSIELRLE